jgi:hypothetical protein
MFAGAAGYTYGSNGAYSYLSDSRPRGAGGWGPGITFREALDRPAGKQMQYLRNLIESRPMLDRVPDQWLIVEDPMSTTERIQACRASDRSYAYVYTAMGKPVRIRLRDTVVQTVAGKVTRAYWYDPRRGTAVHIEDFTKPAAGDNERSQALTTPPSSGPGNDWVLVVEDASRNFPAPGKPIQ